MAKIIQLEAHVADLIAAGEVVERPASVIKELIENSIDAGANKITVEIKGGGMTYMRVSDNGCGIAAAEAETAFLRHATSKLRDEKGLEAILTLGFRGEALAAVAAVSRIALLTRETGAEMGTSLTVEGGVVKNKEIAGCPEGTTMIVRDLFYNTPARLKFMKTDRAEGAGVSAQVISCALSHPEVSIRYIKDGKEECHTPGDGRVDSCVYSLFGRDFAGGLIKTQTSDDDVTATGFVSAPAFARGNRSYQFFFVNGRYVRSKTLQAALEQAYRNTLFTGRFPSCVLYITLSPSQVDVNVHPTKTEVKFQNERKVFDSVYYAALSALESEGRPAEIKLSDGTKDLLKTTDLPKQAPTPAQEPPVRSTSFSGAPETKHIPIHNVPGAGDRLFKGYDRGFSSRVPAVAETTAFHQVHDATNVLYRAAETATETAPEELQQDDMLTDVTGDGGTPYRFVGEALGTYILAEKGDSLWLIDKHAAHERINFDRLLQEKQVTMSQTLVSPVVADLGMEDTALLVENADIFEKLGFSLETFGETAVAVRHIPSDIELDDVEGLLGEMAQFLRRGGQPDEGLIFDALRHTIACKAAIKAGRRSEPQELEALISRVLSGEVRYCPHGRPVAFELTRSALDRNFKRT